jgi:MFS-type transporter involved in bile tolerance (Atg22 family)
LHTLSLFCEIGLLLSFALSYKVTASVDYENSDRTAKEVIIYITVSCCITIIVFVSNIIGAKTLFFVVREQTVATASLARNAVAALPQTLQIPSLQGLQIPSLPGLLGRSDGESSPAVINERSHNDQHLDMK